MCDEHLRIYRGTPRRANVCATDQPIASESHPTQMCPEHRRSGAWTCDSLREFDLVDPYNSAFEDLLAAALDLRTCCQAVWTFWGTLAGVDQQIVQLRSSIHPPVPFETIARQLGPDRTAATVRQRHCRLLCRTRKHLREPGLVGG